MTINTSDDEKLLTEGQVARLLGVSVSWLQRGRCYGYGPRFIKLRKPKGAIRYRLSDLQAYIQENTVDPNPVGRVEARQISTPARR